MGVMGRVLYTSTIQTGFVYFRPMVSSAGLFRTQHHAVQGPLIHEKNVRNSLQRVGTDQ